MLRTIQDPTPMLQRIWKAGALAVGGVIAVNLLIRAVAYAAFDVPSSFPLLQIGPAVVWTALFVGVLALFRAFVELRSRRGASSFSTIAVTGLAILLCIDAMLMLVPVLPGTGSASIMTLAIMQATGTGLSIYFLSLP